LLTLAKAENREAAGQIRESLLLNDFVLDIVSDWLPAASQKILISVTNNATAS
jgi:hypothetical protein